jgi:hypothetical protein
VVATTPRQRLNERRKLRQWQAAQMRAFPSLDDLFDDPEEARKAFMEAFEEVIAEDPFFSAFEFELAENPDADPDAIATALELAYPDDDPDDPDRPMPKALFVAPAVSIRRRSCGTSRRTTGNGTGNGKGGGGGGNDDNDADSDGDSSSANHDNDTKIETRAEARAKEVMQMVATTPRQWLNEHCHTVNITHCIEDGESKIAGIDAQNLAIHWLQAEAYINDSLSRWQAGSGDERCHAILRALLDASARSPRFALSARAISKATGLHHQVIKRLIRGDKRCRAKLMGLVAWLNGKGRRGTRYWLTPEGAKVAELLAKGFQVGKATLTALATDRLRRKMAHQNGTPTENNTMLPYGSYNECSLTAVAISKPVRKPLSPLAERLCRDYGIRWWVAEDLVARYSPLEIKAAIALLEWRKGAIYNPAGFFIYSLREGYARRLAEAWLRKPQCARPPRKPPDEPDWDAIVAALRDALAPYGIRVDDEGSADFPNGRVKLPPDPDKALDLLRRHGLLRDGNGQDADQDPADAPDQAPTDADALTDDAPTDADATEALRAADDADDGDDAIADPLTYPTDGDDDDDEDDDDGEPLPPPSCDLCGRFQGEPHPALNKGLFNNLMALSRLSDAFKHRFGLPEFGVICRGCYMTLCRTLILGGQPDPAADQAPKDAVADANPDSHQPDQSDGQNDPSDDGENCPSPSVKFVPLPDSAAEAF